MAGFYSTGHQSRGHVTRGEASLARFHRRDEEQKDQTGKATKRTGVVVAKRWRDSERQEHHSFGDEC